MGNLTTKKLVTFCTLASILNALALLGNKDTSGLNLGDAFAQSEQAQPTITDVEAEVEPVVVGREKWSDKPVEQTSKPNTPTESNSLAIQELDPLETKQNKTEGIDMKIAPPVIPPAVNLHRNFEGTLVLKPRTLGFEKDFPFQLENTQGRRLAFVDTEDLKVIDPLLYKGKRVNILGKLEPIEEGKKDLVIRARILRSID
ncbi:MAG: hypothetical protein VX038_05780 [Verrucomicrobiota bacterium]|nr:hypothetical protein [Verrucomicrobiota bacterium]